MAENNKTSSDQEASSQSTSISEEQAAELQTENSREAEQKREEREKEEKIEDSLKLVIDTATIECSMCTNPIGILKVNFDTPTIQSKKTATVIEKDTKSLIFFGNCTKSPNSASPCAAVMQLADWKDVGSLKVQEQFPLLLKSTIKCNYGGVDIKITDCAQITEPESIETDGAPVPEQKVEKTNGYYYNFNGTYEGNVKAEKLGADNDVYACEGKGIEKDTFLKPEKLTSIHDKFIRDASTTYGESSAAYNIIDKNEFFAIASVHKRNKVAFGVNSDFAKKFRNFSDVERNKNEGMKYSIAAEINALVGGEDFSNGAKQWDGAEQTHIPEKTPDISSNGKFMFKVNVMGWEITDVHFKSWKAAVSKKFGEKYFTAPQKKYAVANYGGMTNKNKIRLNSVAQYGLTMFWKEVDITKPKEK